MDIQAVSTEQGLDLLLHHVEDRVKRYVFLGHPSPDNTELDALVTNYNAKYENITPYIIYEEAIEAAFYDVAGVLTFNLPLPYEASFGAYIYGIALIGEQDMMTIINEGEEPQAVTHNIVVSISKTPKIDKIAGIGGTFCYKVAISGEPAEIIYSTDEYATKAEAIAGEKMDKTISPFTLKHVFDVNIQPQLDEKISEVNTKLNGATTAINAKLDEAAAAIIKASRIAAPIGIVYMQLAGMAAPADLWGGTWSNISSKFAGRFFRAEGGNAAAFGSNQANAMLNITGSIYVRLRGGAYLGSVSPAGALYAAGTQSVELQGQGGLGSAASGIGIDASRSVGSANIANEIRPINSTTRIWQRVA